MNWEARAKLTAEGDQLISALTEPEVTTELQHFRDAIFSLDDMLQRKGLDRGSRINAIAGGAARCLLERYGRT